MFTLNCRGRLLSLNTPAVMGIINVNSDSFYKGNRKPSVQEAVDLAGKMLEDGAEILDLGGQSTRPGSVLLSDRQEADRVIPAVAAVARAFPDAILSVDTFYSRVAVDSVRAGAAIINDISGGTLDDQMISIVGRMTGVPYICMHMRGTPQTMTQLTHYDNLITELLDFFIAKIEECQRAGIQDFIVDPGLGFAKTITQNFEILSRLNEFSILGKPLFIGLSRKGMVYKKLGITAEEALNGTTALHMIALNNGAHILRVHDVREAVECVKLWQCIKDLSNAVEM